MIFGKSTESLDVEQEVLRHIMQWNTEGKYENNCNSTPSGQVFKSIWFAVHNNRIPVFTLPCF